MGRDCNSSKIPGGEESYVGDPLRFELSGKIMLIAIVVLFSIAALILSFFLYTRYVLRHRQRRNRARQLHHHRSWHHLLFPLHHHPTTTSRGLDASVLASLPVFAFSSKTHQTSLECAVCLSEFEEDEKGRLLPECNHSFHIDCIDMWFLSHSSCPLCRASVIPELPEKSTHVSANRADGDPEVGSSSGFCSSSRVGQETGPSSSSSSSTSSSSLSSVVFF